MWALLGLVCVVILVNCLRQKSGDVEAFKGIIASIAGIVISILGKIMAG